MKAWTVDEMMAEKPCSTYPRERVAELWGDHTWLTLRDILNLPIPAPDKMWVATRLGALPYKVLSRWIEALVGRAVEEYALHCGEPGVEQWARRWLSGEDRSEEAACEAVAWAVGATREAARAAVAWAVGARAVTRAAARAAVVWAMKARAAAKAAARAAAESVFAAARAEAAEEERQLSDLIAILDEAEGREG